VKVTGTPPPLKNATKRCQKKCANKGDRKKKNPQGRKVQQQRRGDGKLSLVKKRRKMVDRPEDVRPELKKKRKKSPN